MGHAFTVLLQHREHQNTVTGVTDDCHQPEYRAGPQQYAISGNRGKVIGRTENGLEESDPHDCCSRSVKEKEHKYGTVLD